MFIYVRTNNIFDLTHCNLVRNLSRLLLRALEDPQKDLQRIVNCVSNSNSHNCTPKGFCNIFTILLDGHLGNFTTITNYKPSVSSPLPHPPSNGDSKAGHPVVSCGQPLSWGLDKCNSASCSTDSAFNVSPTTNYKPSVSSPLPHPPSNGDSKAGHPVVSCGQPLSWGLDKCNSASCSTDSAFNVSPTPNYRGEPEQEALLHLTDSSPQGKRLARRDQATQ